MIGKIARLVRTLVLTTVTCLACLGGANTLAAQQIETHSVVTFHAPKSFFDVLTEIQGSTQTVLTATTEWFPTAEADAWVVFYSGPSDLIALPDLAQKVIEAVAASPNPLVRVNAKLAKRDELPIQINHLEKTDRGVQFQGCLAAVDVFSAFADDGTAAFEQHVGICDRYRQ